MNACGKEWTERPERPGEAARMAAALAAAEGVPEKYARIAASLLSRRGVGPDEMHDFMNPSFSQIPDPSELPGIAQAAALALDTAAAGGKIAVFGDYDVDGVCAVSILVRVLRKCGANAFPFIPLREGEGYGLTDAAIARLLSACPSLSLVLTVDNGISAAREVESLRRRGVKTIVTDHHTPGSDVPQADVVVDPHLACDPRHLAEDLCGAGVAFLLASAIAKGARERGMIPGGVKFAGAAAVLAGLATVTDIVPLRGANRSIVHESLRLFRRHAPTGLKELYAQVSRQAADGAAMQASCYGYVLGPRLNACGRMSDAMEAYDLLMCGWDAPPDGKAAAEAREKARRAAVSVEARNAERRTVEKDMAEAALAQAGEDSAAAAFVVAGDKSPCDGAKSWHPGVAGIVAAKLVEKTGRPCAVAVRFPGGMAHGSARAPAGYDIHAALSACSRVLERFGGHAAAGGFSLAKEKIPEFRRLFAEACAAQMPEGAASPAMFDGWIGDFSAFDCGWTEVQARLEPFGDGNPEPVFGLAKAMLSKVTPVGADGRHLAVEFRPAGAPRAQRGIWWRHGEDAEGLRAASLRPFAIFATPFRSEYDPGAPSLEWRICDILPQDMFPGV